MKTLIAISCTLFLSLTACNSKKETPKNLQQTTPEVEIVKTPIQTATQANVIDYYICFKDNTKPSRVIWVSYNSKGIALSMKYKGQQEAIKLAYLEEDFQAGGAHPTIVNHYNEIYKNKVNGSYSITHSGNWDYVKYTRLDGKIFNFTIDHNANPYGKEPCF